MGADEAKLDLYKNVNEAKSFMNKNKLFFLLSIEPKKKGRITLINNFEEPEDCPQTLETLLEKINELNKKVQANTEEIFDERQASNDSLDIDSRS